MCFLIGVNMRSMRILRIRMFEEACELVGGGETFPKLPNELTSH